MSAFSRVDEAGVRCDLNPLIFRDEGFERNRDFAPIIARAAGKVDD